AGEAPRDAVADDHLVGAGPEHAPGKDLHLIAQSERFLVDATQGHVGRAHLTQPADVGEHDHLGAGQGPAVRSHRHLGERAENVGAVVRDGARDLRIRSRAQDDHVGGRAGLDQRGLESVRHGERADQDGHDQSDAARGGQGASRTLPQVPQVVRERNPHDPPYSTRRSASTTARREARIAGTSPLTMPMASAMATPRATVSQVTVMGGRNPPALKRVPSIMNLASRAPAVPPMPVIRSASASTMPNTVPSVNPSVFKTASSPRRSRIAIIIVLAATPSMESTTASPMSPIKNGMLPYMLTKPAWNARSVSVRVAAAEFS